MDRALPLFAIGLVFGGGLGFVAAAGAGVTLDGHDHAKDHGAHSATTSMSGGRHDHGALLSLSAETAPTLAIDLAPDAASGWNLHVKTTGFRFAPEHASGAAVAGEGHAHVYVNGDKIARLYGPWLHIGSLPPGKATVRVTLNANDHRALAVDGRPVAAETVVETR